MVVWAGPCPNFSCYPSFYDPGNMAVLKKLQAIYVKYVINLVEEISSAI